MSLSASPVFIFPMCYPFEDLSSQCWALDGETSRGSLLLKCHCFHLQEWTSQWSQPPWCCSWSCWSLEWGSLLPSESRWLHVVKFLLWLCKQSQNEKVYSSNVHVEKSHYFFRDKMSTCSYKLDRGRKYQILFYKQYLQYWETLSVKLSFCLDRRKKKGNPYTSAKAQKAGWLESLFTAGFCLWGRDRICWLKAPLGLWPTLV